MKTKSSRYILVLLCSPYIFFNTIKALDNKQQIETTTKQLDLSSLDSISSTTKEKANIYLNVKDTSLKNIVNYLADQKNINLITHKDLENLKVSISTRTPLTLNQAWNTLLTLLETNGFSLIESNGTYEVIANSKTKQEPLPSYIDTDPNNLPDNDTMIRYVYFFKNIKTDDIQPIIQPMLGQNNVLFNSNLNSCLITQKSLNIKTTMKLIKELDSSGLRESIQIIQLKYTNSENVAQIFNEQIIGDNNSQPQARPRNLATLAQQKKRDSFFSKSTRIIPDPRTNKLILLGTQTNLQRVINFINKYIDQPLEAEYSRLHVKELKYTDAEKIKPILDSITKPPASQQGKTPLAGQTKYFEDMIVAAESTNNNDGNGDGDGGANISIGAGNRLLVACTRDDWNRIEQFIDKLDKPQPQVAMEILFVDAKRDDERALGAQLRNKNPGDIGKGINLETRHLINQTQADDSGNSTPVFHIPDQKSEIDSTSSDANASYMTFGPTNNLWGVVKTVLATNNYNIISQPYLVATNNQQSKLVIKESKRIQGGIDTSSTSPVNKYEDVDATTEVTLTPGINKEGTLNLSISISIDEFIENTNNARRTRNLKTKAIMTDGEVLVIGGLTQTKIAKYIYKTPILGSIPVIGNLFKQRSRSKEEKDLFVFIRPTLIKPRFEGKPDEYTQLKLDYSKYQISSARDFLVSNDPIERWFFMPPSKDKIKTLEDVQDQDIKPILEFTQGKDIPQSVIPSVDPYYESAESPEFKRYQQREKSYKKIKKQKKRRSKNK